MSDTFSPGAESAAASGGAPPVILDAPPPASAWTGIGIGVEVGLQRLARRSTWLVSLLGIALAVVGAIIERRVSSAGAVDRALHGAVGLILPLVVFAIVTGVIGRAHLREACWSAARFGVARRDVALGIVIATAGVGGAVALLIMLTSVVAAHSTSAPPLAGDALTSAWIGALTGAAYVGWFSFGATIFQRGGGRFIPLTIDLVLGGSAGIVGVILPRGNAQNLIGGLAPLGLSQPASTAILLTSAIVLGVGAAIRCRE
jgi:hypothetical protein